MLATGVPWEIKADNGPTYTSQTFKSWKIKHSTGITYNPQSQAIMERINRSLKGELAKVSSENKKDPPQALVEVLFERRISWPLMRRALVLL